MRKILCEICIYFENKFRRIVGEYSRSLSAGRALHTAENRCLDFKHWSRSLTMSGVAGSESEVLTFLMAKMAL